VTPQASSRTATGRSGIHPSKWLNPLALLRD